MLFSRDDLLRVLHGQNPWWTGRAPRVPEFRRPVWTACRRHLSPRSGRFVLLVSGLRGTGKTTLLLQLAADLVAQGADARSVLYLGMGHPVFGGVPLPQVLQLHREMVFARERPAVLLLDEAHYAHDWDRHIKALLGEQAGYRIVATESVQMIERALVTETQEMRWNSISAPTLSFHEYLTLRGLDPLGGRDTLDLTQGGAIPVSDLDRTVREIQAASPHFRPFMTNGGLPSLAAGAGEKGVRGSVQDDVVENVLRRDIALHFGARSVEDLKRLFVYLCLHSGDVFPVQRYARAVGVSATTVASHLELLERCFLVRRLAPAGGNGGEVQKARYRVFASDTTLRSAQLLRDQADLGDPEELQRVVATSVVRHVVERYATVLAQFRYWRDPRRGGKVDVIVREAGRQTAYQVTPDHEQPLAPTDPLVTFCRAEPVARAFLVTTDDAPVAVLRVRGSPTEFVKVPAYALAYLLGHAEARAAAAAGSGRT